MSSTIPVWIIFISSLLNIEKTNIFQIFGVILSLIGVVFIISKADIDLLKNLKFNKGDLTMIVAMFSWAIYSALLKKKRIRNISNNITTSCYNLWIDIFNSYLFY